MKHKLKTLVMAIGLAACTASQAAPQEPGVVVTVEGTKVTAFWNPVIGAKGYTLFYAPAPYAGPETIGSVPVEEGTDLTVDLPVGASYFVAIKAKDAAGESDYSNIEKFTVKTPNPEDANASIPNILSSIGTNVVLASYDDLATKAQGLVDRLVEFQSSSTDENLRKVQFAWRDARRPWEQTESFLFGPVDSQGLDPSLDSWPVNRTDLDNVLNSDKTLDVPTVEALEDTSKGFHTIEYLIFGEANNETAAGITARESEYLVSATTVFHQDADELADAWRPAKGNFLEKLATAGEAGNTTYPSEASALEELVTGMIVIIDEVGNAKIADPFSETNAEKVESQFSYNSLLDFENNIRGAENVYLGRYLQKDGPGLNDLVRRNDAELDTKIRQKFDAAINAIQAIPFPFRDSISNEQGRALISTAQLKTSELQAVIEGELKPKIASYN